MPPYEAFAARGVSLRGGSGTVSPAPSADMYLITDEHRTLNKKQEILSWLDFYSRKGGL